MKSRTMRDSRTFAGRAKRITVCAMVVLVAFLLCGCLKMHIDVVWNEDNSATIATTIGMTKSAMMMMEMTEADIQQQFRESMDSGDGDYTFTAFSDSEYAGIIATMRVVDITKDSTDSIEELHFTSTGEGKNRTYSVSGNLSGSSIAGDSGDLDESGISLGDIDMKLSIDMPGKITSHNATEKKGNVLTWVLNSASTTSIQATSEAGGGLSLGLILLIAGGVVLIAVVIVIIMLMRKKKSAAASEPPSYMGAPQGYDPYQAPPAAPPQAQPASPLFQQPAAQVVSPPPPVYQPEPQPVAPPPPVYQPEPQPVAPPPPVYQPEPQPVAPPPPVYQPEP
ncbi:MAG: hypothetical protein FWG48_06260, partial [Oscillospiraceae bacterium]|nr:hypothetical protein [Oscillospiraceae bacterium]